MSEEIRADILERAAHGVLLDAIFREYGKHSSEDADPTIAALADLHNEGAIDLLAIVTLEALEPYKGYIFFRGQHIYNKLISHLDAPAEALVAAVEALIQTAGNDLAAHWPVEEFAKWCEGNPARPAELLSLVDQKVPNADHFLIIAITKGVAVDRDYFMGRAYDFLISGSESEKRAAVMALGQVPLYGPDDWDRLLSAFTSLLDTDPGDLIRSSVLRAIVQRLDGASTDRRKRLIDIGKAAANPKGDQLLNAAARTLAFKFVYLPNELIEALLGGLLSVDSSHTDTIDMLDMALVKLVEHGQSVRVRSFVTQLLRREADPIDLEQFDSLRYQLFQTGGQVLEDWVVDWLLNGDFALCGPMNDTLFAVDTENHVFQIDFARFDLLPEDYPYLARKAIGTFFVKPMLMTSLVTSLLRTAPAEVTLEIVGLLVDPILTNYSGVASDLLEPIAADEADPAAAYVQRALEEKEKYLEGLGSIGVLPELHPSERERLMEWQRHTDSMAAAFSESRKKSIIASLATELLMLYGTGSVSWVSDRSAPPRRIETPLATISHSFELPRTDIVDPIGLQQMIISFRRETRSV